MESELGTTKHGLQDNVDDEDNIKERALRMLTGIHWLRTDSKRGYLRTRG